jgi:hypothetical protein
MGEMRNAYNILIGKPAERNHLENLGVDWKIMLERMLYNKCGLLWTGFIWLRLGTDVGLL